MINEDSIQESVGLFFDVIKNRFIDEDGFIVWNIYEIITPKDVYLFKHKGKNMVVRHRKFKEIDVELYFPDDGWDIDEDINEELVEIWTYDGKDGLFMKRAKDLVVRALGSIFEF